VADSHAGERGNRRETDGHVDEEKSAEGAKPFGRSLGRRAEEDSGGNRGARKRKRFSGDRVKYF